VLSCERKRFEPIFTILFVSGILLTIAMSREPLIAGAVRPGATGMDLLG
jgi:hypothetical protein